MRRQRTIVITGASDGIGAESARQLAANGHRVVVVGRSPEKTAAVAAQIDAPFLVADFADLAQVRSLAAELLHTYPRVDVLANNAGGLFSRTTTRDGFEKTFQVNHLAPFLLTHLLLERLTESTATVVQTSSIAHRTGGRLDLDDLADPKNWNQRKAYGDSKLANLLFTRELHRRFHSKGINAVAFHPGGVATNFAGDTAGLTRFVYHSPVARLLTSVETGGARLTWLAQGTPGLTWQPGGYYARNRPARTSPQARDDALAESLWRRSELLLAL